MLNKLHQVEFIGSIASLMSQFRETPNLHESQVRMAELMFSPKLVAKADLLSPLPVAAQRILRVNLGLLLPVALPQFLPSQWKSAMRCILFFAPSMKCQQKKQSLRQLQKNPSAISQEMISMQKQLGRKSLNLVDGKLFTLHKESPIGADPAKILVSAQPLVETMATIFMYSRPQQHLKQRSRTPNLPQLLTLITMAISVKPLAH